MSDYLRGGEVEEGRAVERSVGVVGNGERNTTGGGTTGGGTTGGGTTEGGTTGGGTTGGGGNVGGSDAEVVVGVDSVGGSGHERGSGYGRTIRR